MFPPPPRCWTNASLDKFWKPTKNKLHIFGFLNLKTFWEWHLFVEFVNIHCTILYLPLHFCWGFAVCICSKRFLQGFWSFRKQRSRGDFPRVIFAARFPREVSMPRLGGFQGKICCKRWSAFFGGKNGRISGDFGGLPRCFDHSFRLFLH